MEFSQRLAELKSKKRCSNDAIAKACGVSEGAVRSWLNGSKIPGSDKVKAMAGFFCVSSDYLMGGDEKKLLVNDDEELTNYLEELRSRPEKRMLFSVTKNATKAQVEAIVKMIEEMTGN